MNYQVIEKEAFTVVGLRYHFPDMETGTQQISSLWQQAEESGQMAQLLELRNTDEHLNGTLGLCIHENSGTAYDYFIGVPADSQNSNSSFAIASVPAGKYLVFDVPVTDVPIGESIQETYHAIFETVLPNSSYTYTQTHDFEFYAEKGAGTADWVVQVWMPVK